jgi:hypothetical protein
MYYDVRRDKERELWKFCTLEYKNDPEYAFQIFLEERKGKEVGIRKLLKTIASIF